MNHSELPDLPGVTAEPNERARFERTKTRQSKGASTVALVTTGFVVLALAVVISGAFTLLGKDQLLMMVGAKLAEKRPDKTAIAIQELTAQLQLFSVSLDDLEKKHAELLLLVDTNTASIDKTTLRVTNIERFTSDLEKRIADHRKAQQMQAIEQKKKVAQTKPKPPAIIPVVLVSIRNQAGTPFVALRDGLDKSELLMPGDTWRGWTLLEASPMTKIARFKVNGQVQELRL
jgi:hypothetical protein